MSHQQSRPDPLEAVIRARNARRVARRASVASLAQSINRVSGFRSLTRGGRDPVQIGGRFQAIEALPPRIPVEQERQVLSQADFNKFLSAFKFQGQTEVQPRQDRTVFGPRTSAPRNRVGRRLQFGQVGNRFGRSSGLQSFGFAPGFSSFVSINRSNRPFGASRF